MLLGWSRVPLLDKRKQRDDVAGAVAFNDAGGAGNTWEAFVAIEACEEVWSLCGGGCGKNEFRCFVCTWRVMLVDRFSRLLAGVFGFSRIRVHVRAQEMRLTGYLNRFLVRSGETLFRLHVRVCVTSGGRDDHRKLVLPSKRLELQFAPSFSRELAVRV